VSNEQPRLLWDFSSLAAGHVLSMLLGFVGFAYLARALSPESYGLIEYGVGLAGLAAIVIEGGLGPVASREVARERTRASELAGTVVTLRLTLTLVLVPLVGLSSYATGQTGPVTTLVWLYALTLLAVPLKQDWLLQGLERMSLVAPAQALKSAVFAVGVFVIVRSSDDLVRVGIVEIAAALAFAIYYVVAQRTVAVPLTLRAPNPQMWPLLRAGAVVGASNMVWTFMLYVPIFLVTNMAGSAQAAWLGAAQRIVYSLVGLSALYFFNLYPVIARRLHEDVPAWEGLMNRSYRLVAWTSLGAALVSTIAADTVIRVVFGPGFSSAVSVFSIYIWLFPIRLLAGHARWTLVAGGRQGLMLLSEMFATGTLLTIGVWLIPEYGAFGAAIAVVTANIVGWISAHIFAARHVGRLPSLRLTLAPVVSVLASATPAVWFLDRPAFGIGIASLSYLACIWLAGGDLLRDAMQLAQGKATGQA
jgi:O-antigen/teichoic acid export membrane protein